MCSFSLHRKNRTALDCNITVLDFIITASDCNSLILFVNKFIQFQLLMNVAQLSNFKTFSIKLMKFIFCKLVLLFSLLVIRVSGRNFKSSHRSLFAPKIFFVFGGRWGAIIAHTLFCSAFPYSLFTWFSPTSLIPSELHTCLSSGGSTLGQGWTNPGCQLRERLSSWQCHVEFVGPRRRNCFV